MYIRTHTYTCIHTYVPTHMYTSRFPPASPPNKLCSVSLTVLHIIVMC